MASMRTIFFRRGNNSLFNRSLVWLILLIISILILIIIFKNSGYIESEEFGLVRSLEKLNKVTFHRIWPSLRGYESIDANAVSHPIDPLLLGRLQLNERIIRKPLLRVKDNSGIPAKRHKWKFEKIIHQSWKTGNIPQQTAPWVKKWLELNPDWTYIFWTDDSARAFLSEHYPNLLPVYDSWTIPVQKADMFRLIALYTFGGVYADLDMEPLKPLDEIRNWSSCILSREPDVQTYVMANDLNVWANNYTFTCNAFMACQSHHPFLQYMIIRIKLRSPLVTGQACPLAETILCTGPMFLSLSYGFYRRSIPRRDRETRKELDVICPQYEYFLPTCDETRLERARTACRQYRSHPSPKQLEVCKIWESRGYENQPFNYSFTNHRWFHSYHYDVQKNRSKKIMEVTKPVIWRVDDEDQYFQVDYSLKTLELNIKAPI